MSGMARIAQPGAAELEAVRAVAPLSADLTIRCGPFDVPVAVLAMSTSLEREDSPEGQLTRDFVEQDPWHGMGSVYPGGWMLLARDDDTIVVGQRKGDIGMGYVVVFERRNEHFAAARMGGWRLLPRATAQQIEACFLAQVDGATITVGWTNEQNMDHIPTRIVAHVEILERSADVHFLLHTVSNSPRPRRGTGRREKTTFELREPLGNRLLISDQQIPPDPLDVCSL